MIPYCLKWSNQKCYSRVVFLFLKANTNANNLAIFTIDRIVRIQKEDNLQLVMQILCQQLEKFTNTNYNLSFI